MTSKKTRWVPPHRLLLFFSFGYEFHEGCSQNHGIFGWQTSYCLIIISVDHCSSKWPSQALVRWPNFLIPVLKRSPLNVLLRQYEGIKPGDLDPDWFMFRLSSMSLNKLLNSLSQISHLYNEDYDGAAVRIKWVCAYKALQQCLVDSSCSAS